MTAVAADGPPAPPSDPIADARALVAMAIGLGKRARTVQHLDQTTDRKAALYVSTLVRHAARLLQSTTAHEVPTMRASSNGPGGSAVHYVIRLDRLAGPPAAVRFLVVGSDARLRCCVAPEAGGSRVWADYDVATAPEDLPLRSVLDSLSALIARLEHAVTQMEVRQIARDAALDADIEVSKARIAGLPEISERSTGVKRDVASEEPVRPWTRHVATATAPAPSAAGPSAPAPSSPAPSSPAPSSPAPSSPAPGTASAPDPTRADVPAVSSADDIFAPMPNAVDASPPVTSAPQTPNNPAPDEASAGAGPPVQELDSAPALATEAKRRGFRLSRIDRAI